MKRTLLDREAVGWWLYPVIAAAVLLTMAASLCLFDADHHARDSHLGALDLCLGWLFAVLTVALFVGLPLTGWAAPDRFVHLPAPALLIPAPPPKSALRF